MPTYEYQCGQCHREFEVRQPITAAPLTHCEACGGALKRLLSSAPFILKGEGWYVTDYPSEARKKAQKAEKSANKSTDKAAASTEKSSTSATNTSATTAPSTGAATSGSSSSD